ncbi:OsmC family protein [Arthrobacter woluwensis]|uniref:OsmC family protein n=1 Tax=Arthrobacter woluwensis TaxID=156980 RepID=UPI0038117DC0
MADHYSVTAQQTAAQNFTVRSGENSVEVGIGTFMPTELLLGSLGSCILSVVSDYAQRNGIELSAPLTVQVDGDMANKPRRMGSIAVRLGLPEGLTDSQRQALLRASKHCTIHATLASEPEVTVELLQEVP